MMIKQVIYGYIDNSRDKVIYRDSEVQGRFFTTLIQTKKSKRFPVLIKITVETVPSSKKGRKK